MCHPNTSLDYNVHHPKHGTIRSIYSLDSVQVRYSFNDYKKEKIEGINVSPYLDKRTYEHMIHELQMYVKDKNFTIVQNNGLYLYYDDVCLNTFINNMIIYHSVNKL